MHVCAVKVVTFLTMPVEEESQDNPFQVNITCNPTCTLGTRMQSELMQAMIVEMRICNTTRSAWLLAYGTTCKARQGYSCQPHNNSVCASSDDRIKMNFGRQRQACANSII